MFIANEMQILSFGDYVAVAWNTIPIEVSFDGGRIVRSTRKAIGDPFIIFPIIHRDEEGKYYLDDDDSVSGGLSPEEARQVAAELLLAADWLEENE